MERGYGEESLPKASWALALYFRKHFPSRAGLRAGSGTCNRALRESFVMQMPSQIENQENQPTGRPHTECESLGDPLEPHPVQDRALCGTEHHRERSGGKSAGGSP